ncbi:hypothetical protein HXX01_03975 [Candidatus Nomurabacteria bacterium]|nr:hypothetical protein [Candidatus Nomurabacteria bacterium]
MIHQFRDKNQIAKKRRVIKNLIFLSIFLFLALLGVYASTSPAFHFIGRPIWQAKNGITNSVESIGYMVRTKASVYKENENLLKENADLKTSMIDYQVLKNENISLKESLGRVPQGRDMVLSTILTKPNHSPYDTIIVDVGRDVGINVGSKVYANVLTPIGEVSAVYTKTSLITLYSNPGKSTDAIIDGSNTNVELVGRGGGNFEVIVPVDIPFNKGTSILIPGIQSEIVAIMQDVISLPNDPMKKILLSSPINVQDLKWVFIKRN